MVWRDIGRFIAGLEQLEAQLGIFSDAPFAPAAHFLQRVLVTMVMVPCWMMAIVFVALDHADMEEAAIFLVSHGLEGVLAGVAVILRSLHQGDGGRCE